VFHRLLLLLVVTLAAACTPARREVETDLVARIQFDGNGGPLSGHNDYQLQSQMEQAESSFGALLWPMMYFARPAAFDRDALDRDAFRLEVWYAHNGWFDARFDGWTLRKIRNQGKRRAAALAITGHIDPGPASMFGELTITGLDKTSEIFGRTIRRIGYIQPASQFNLESVYLTRDRMIQVLRDRTRAYAEVDVDIVANPEERIVDVTFAVDPGPVTRFGPITVQGNEVVPTQVIVEKLAFTSGEPYDHSRLGRSQRDLFDLGLFGVVNVAADLSDPEVTEIPVTVRVTESYFRRLRVGGGANYDGQSVTPRLSVDYRHTNLFHRLLRFEAGAESGVAIGLGQSTAVQPIVTLSTGLSTPRLAGPNWGLGLSALVRQDLQNGQFAYREGEAHLDLGWTPSRKVAVGLGPSWQIFQFLQFDSPLQQLIAASLFGRDFKNPYQLMTLDGRVSVDWRDHPVETTRGSFHTLSVKHALPVPAFDSAGQPVQGFHFTDITADTRIYRTLKFRKRAVDYPFSWAGRLKGRLVQQWNSRDVPYPERIFMGGATDVRGFRGQHMGPYDVLCLYDPARQGSFTGEPGAGLAVNRIELPTGGRLGVHGTVELRYEWAYDITWAAFTDMGVLVETPRDLSLDDLRVSAGIGARYRSLIGPVRIDLAFRPLYDDASGIQPQFINCLSDDQNLRRFDLFTRWRNDNRDTPPIAANLLFAIGQAL
jgi:outer membrane protein assembly factor BamA